MALEHSDASGRPEPATLRERMVPSDEYVQSLDRGLSVIRVFNADHPKQTLSQVAAATGLTRAAARRFLLTLVHLGYVETDGKLFALRARVLELGYAYLSSLTLPEVALPHMEALAVQVGDTCTLSVLDGIEVVSVARIPSRRLMGVSINIGSRFPAYATSVGRVLLAAQTDKWLDENIPKIDFEARTVSTITDPQKLRAALDRIRVEGYAIVDRELEPGLCSAAVPIHDSAGAVIAAMNVSLHSERATPEEMRRSLLPLMYETATAIEAGFHIRTGQLSSHA